jgi:hypothetical protein
VSEEIFNLILEILLIILGSMILILKITNPLEKDSGVFGKAAHYQTIVLGLMLILLGIFLI